MARTERLLGRRGTQTARPPRNHTHTHTHTRHTPIAEEAPRERLRKEGCTRWARRGGSRPDLGLGPHSEGYTPGAAQEGRPGRATHAWTQVQFINYGIPIIQFYLLIQFLEATRLQYIVFVSQLYLLIMLWGPVKLLVMILQDHQ